MAYIYKNKYINKIGILGLGISGISVLNYFKNKDVHIHIWDDFKNIREQFNEETYKVFDLNNIANLQKLDLLFVSPGIKLNHPVILLAKKINLLITGDLDLFWQDIYSANDKCIAITGSNGKSTIASLTNFLLSANKINSALRGNIGIPFMSNDGIKDKMTYVLELSSYQLAFMKNLKPNIAILSNLSLDHIEWHGNFKNYVRAKERIFMNQDSADVAIINTDSKEGQNIFNKLKLKKNGPQLIEITTEKNKPNTIYNDNGELISTFNNKKVILGKISNLTTLKGLHNIENIIIAITCLLKLGISFSKIKNFLPKFNGLPHRIEEVKNYKNILFVNDSKSTNLSSSKVALSCYKNIIWIAGGRRKNESFNFLKNHITDIKAGFFIGESSEQFCSYFKNYFYSINSMKLEMALKQSMKYAELMQDEIVILFSPGCSSFDQFDNFEVRGESFKKFVYDYTN
tara:strand:+ start:344 stop:1720 length:1377 start_codon:yes stop_codon:yes gene_type:complete